MKLVLKFLSPLQSCWEWRFLVLGYILGGPLRVHSECFLDVPARHHPASVGTRSPLPSTRSPLPSTLRDSGSRKDLEGRRCGRREPPPRVCMRVGPAAAWAWEEEPHSLLTGFHWGKTCFGK